ncbi:MAG: hypothetical protein JST66_05275 [Bacteroidetes bacterium]|nr:hypothetical protein [Bacteroidota bacterium]
MITRSRTRKKKSTSVHRRVVRQQRPVARPPEPEEGAGNNDERELPDALKEESPASGGHRPPTNAVPDRPQDPARPGYKEPHPKDKLINTLGYDPNDHPYESPDIIDVSRYDIGLGRFLGAPFA